MNEDDVKIIRAMAELDMNVSEVSRKLFMHRNSVLYHLCKIKKETGLDPQKFFGLVDLLDMVGRTGGDEHGGEAAL